MLGYVSRGTLRKPVKRSMAKLYNTSSLTCTLVTSSIAHRHGRCASRKTIAQNGERKIAKLNNASKSHLHSCHIFNRGMIGIFSRASERENTSLPLQDSADWMIGRDEETMSSSCQCNHRPVEDDCQQVKSRPYEKGKRNSCKKSSLELKKFVNSSQYIYVAAARFIIKKPRFCSSRE